MNIRAISDNNSLFQACKNSVVQDGLHIKGLENNFIHHNWSSLFMLNFHNEFPTPCVCNTLPILSPRKVTKCTKRLTTTPCRCSRSGNFVTRIVEYYKGELLLHDANPSKLQGRSAGTNTRTSATPCTTRSAGTRTPTSATPSITRRV